MDNLFQTKEGSIIAYILVYTLEYTSKNLGVRMGTDIWGFPLISFFWLISLSFGNATFAIFPKNVSLNPIKDRRKYIFKIYFLRNYYFTFNYYANISLIDFPISIVKKNSQPKQIQIQKAIADGQKGLRKCVRLRNFWSSQKKKKECPTCGTLRKLFFECCQLP